MYVCVYACKWTDNPIVLVDLCASKRHDNPIVCIYIYMCVCVCVCVCACVCKQCRLNAWARSAFIGA